MIFDDMKLYTELLALCDYATISKENKLSINGIFDELRVSKLPGGLVRAFLVATIHGKPNTSYKISVKLENPYDGKNLLNPLQLDVHTSQNGKHNVIVELVNIGFEKEGEYQFKLYHGDDEIGSTLLKVIDIHTNKDESLRLIN